MKVYKVKSVKALNDEIKETKDGSLRGMVLKAAAELGTKANKPTAEGFKVTAIRATVDKALSTASGKAVQGPRDQISDHLSRSVKAGLLTSHAVRRVVTVEEVVEG